VGRHARKWKAGNLKTETMQLVVRVVGLDEAAAWAEFLTVGEREKAERMANDILRARFVVSRGLRREVLAEMTGRVAGELEFVEEEGSKPRLVDGDGWDFNVSHAGDYVAVAVARGAVGIDVEKLRPVREMAALVQRHFHADEVKAWEQLAEDTREQGFFVLWSAREAAMKCCGLGLAKGLAVTRVDPAFLRRRVAEVAVGDEVVTVEKVEAPAGYVMVVGVQGRRDET